MESPVVLDKPPEYHGNDRGFPFEDEEGSGAWSELAARHPDIAARLRQRPASATWARKRRPSSQDATDDFGENFGGFDRFPFDDIPPEFREHFPSHWNRRFGSREEAHPQSQPQPQGSPPVPQPQQHTAATQTERTQAEPAETDHLQSPLPQYGLRNTVDLGQKSPADPSLVDADERTHRCMSAPPDNRPPNDMNSQQPEHAHAEQASNVRHIPIFVEGRDEPVLNKADSGKQASEPQQPQQPHIDRDQYFADEGPASFHHPPNFSRAFGTPFNKGFRPGPQPFTQQKAYPQNAFTRGASPQRSQSPKQPAPQEEHYVKVPMHHEHVSPKTETPSKPPPRQTPPQQREQTPPQAPPKPSANDPITQILSIQTDVLNLMTEVENFTGSKKDKRYIFLDEMLTRNLIKLDNIETEGKENIRLARKEAIRCIQKCIAVLEAKAEKGSSTVQTDVEMNDNAENTETPAVENGEVAMKEAEPQVKQVDTQKEIDSQMETQPQADEPKTQTPETAPQLSETPLEETKPSEDKPEVQNNVDTPKKKVVKKRGKSKDKAPSGSAEAAKDSNNVAENVDVMQVDSKGDKTEQVMEVDGAASQ